MARAAVERVDLTGNIPRQEPEPERSTNHNETVDRTFPSERALKRRAVLTISGYVVEVNPGMARQWLEANTANRPTRRFHIEGLAREIVEDRWRPTHQGIAFSDQGRLIDGQHRLAAIIRADKPAVLTVFVGISDDMFGALDRGQRRTVADELLESSRYVDPCSWLVSRLRAPSGHHRAAPHEVRDVLAVYKETLLAMIGAAPISVRLRGTAGVKAAVMVRIKGANDHQRKILLEQWDGFIRLRTEMMDGSTSALLRRLQNISPRDTAYKISTEAAIATWIAFNPTNRDMDRIVFPHGDKSINELCSAAAIQIGVS